MTKYLVSLTSFFFFLCCVGNIVIFFSFSLIYNEMNFEKQRLRIFISKKLFLIPPSPGRVAQSVGHLTRKSGVLGVIPGLATYFRFSFRFFKKASCQLLAKVCARSTG